MKYIFDWFKLRKLKKFKQYYFWF